MRVRACSINYPDVLIIEDKYQLKPPRPFAPGSEIAGEVEAVGTLGHATPDEVLAVYRIGLRALADSEPRFIDIPESDRPVVQLPIGRDLILSHLRFVQRVCLVRLDAAKNSSAGSATAVSIPKK